MKDKFLWLVIAAVSCYIACDCPPMYPLDEEGLKSPFQVKAFFSEEVGELILTFNKPVDSTSLIAQKTLTIGGGDTKYTGYFMLSQDHLSVRVPNCEIYCNNALKSCPFTLRLDGDINDGMAIRSENGQLLDGDKDGSDGGDFIQDEHSSYDCGNYTLTVNDPPNGSSASFSANGPNPNIVLELNFSESMDTNSVMPGVNVYLQCQNNSAVKETGTVTWPTRFRMRFTSKKTIAELKTLCTQPSTYIFTILGNGPHPVKSVYGIGVENDTGYDFTMFLF